MSTSIIRGLEILCTVIEEGSATAAAHRLGLSQPAVSQQIARLEKEISLVLFVRQNGRMHPTEAALSIYDEAGHAFDGLDRVLNLARDIRRLERGLLRIAAPHSIAATYLPQALKALTSGHPQLRLQVRLGTYEHIVSLVAAREVDLGIAKAPIMSPGVDSIDICDSGLVAVMNGAHRLATKSRLNPADLSQEPLIMIGRGRPWRDEIDVAFRRQQIAMRVSVETQSVESACGFAAEGFGTAIVPHWLTGALHGMDVAVVPFDIDIRHRFIVTFAKRTQRAEIAQDLARAFMAFPVTRSDAPHLR